MAVEVRGLPSGHLGVDPFNSMVHDSLPIAETLPRMRFRPDWLEPLRALRASYPEATEASGPVVVDPQTEAPLHQLMSPAPDRSRHSPDRVLFVAAVGPLSALNRYRYPETGQPVVCAPLSELRNFAIFCDATGARQYFLGMRDAGTISLFQLERDGTFRKRTMAGAGRAMVLDVINPTPQVRVLLDYSGSFKQDPEVRTVSPVQIIGDRQVPLGGVGAGSARLVSPPLAPQAIGSGRYIVLHLADPRRNPNRLSAAERLWGGDIARDRRWLTGHIRDLSILSEEEYAAFRPPAHISQFPNDLAHPHLEYSGLYEDSWAGREFKVRLTPTGPNQEAVIRGQIPQVTADGAGFQTELTVLIDDIEVGKKRLATGDFEVRVPGGAGEAPRWIECRFSHSQKLPPPDGRIAIGQIKFIGFEPRNEALSRPPEHLSTFPKDLSHPKLDHSGIYTDGWGEKTIRTRLHQAAPDAEIVLRGQLPEVGGNTAFLTEVVMLLDGTEVCRKTLVPGDFEMRAPAGKTAQARWVECRFTHTQTLPPPDGRSVGAHIRFLGFESPRPAP